MFPALPLGQFAAQGRRLRRGLRQGAVARTGRAARRPRLLHRRQRGRVERRAKKPFGPEQRGVSRGVARRHAFARRQYGFRLQPRRAPPFARSRGGSCRMREKAQTWSANARLYLLRLRKPAGVVSSVVASERPLAACAFEGTLSLEVGGCRTSFFLRLLAAGAWSGAIRAATRPCRRFARLPLSRAPLFCEPPPRARPF